MTLSFAPGSNTTGTGSVRPRFFVVLALVLAIAVSTIGAPQARALPATARGDIFGVKLAPGTAGLTPDLAIAYTMAKDSARVAGVNLYINSGKRSRREQNALWQQGIATYGSPQAARRWVLPPWESTHVTGEAIDVGPRAGATWLQANGIRWGLCRTFTNEWWHFERVAIPGTHCPRRLPDASYR